MWIVLTCNELQKQEYNRRDKKTRRISFIVKQWGNSGVAAVSLGKWGNAYWHKGEKNTYKNKNERLPIKNKLTA